jgi:hypothetical protein
VFLYISDHGNLRSGTGSGNAKGVPVINLWHELMSPDDLREAVRFLGAFRRLVIVLDQCFSGDMVESLFGVDAFTSKKTLNGNACAFAAAAPGRTSYSTQQLMVTLDQYLNDPTIASTVWDEQGKSVKFDEFMRQTQLEFETVPITSSESFLLSYYEKYQDKIDAKKNRLGDLVKPSEQTKAQYEVFKKMLSRLGKLDAGICKASLSSLDDAEECLVQIAKKERKLFEDQNRRLFYLKAAFLKSIPLHDRNLIEEYLPLSRARARNLDSRLAHYEESQTPNLKKIEKLKKKIRGEKEALEALKEKAAKIGQLQEAALAGENPNFIGYLESQRKLSELHDFKSSKSLSLQLKNQRILVLKYQRILQLLAALENMENDQESLTYYLNLVKCETEPFSL